MLGLALGLAGTSAPAIATHPGDGDSRTLHAGEPLAGVAGGRLSNAQIRALRLDRWHRVDGPGVTVYSNGQPRQIRRATADLLRFRDGALKLLGLSPDQIPDHPLTIFLLRSSTTATLLGDGQPVLGYMVPGLRNHRIVATMIDRGRVLGSRNVVMLHEYVHYLLRSSTSFHYAPWYSEGVAELLSTAIPTRRGLRFGEAPASALAWLAQGNPPALPVATLAGYRLGSDPRGGRRLIDQAGFYRQSWLLAHYLLFGPGNARAPLAEYLQRFDAGEDGRQAFETAFATAFTEGAESAEASPGRPPSVVLDERLRSYRSDRYRFELPLSAVEDAADWPLFALTPPQARLAAATLLRHAAPATVIEWLETAEGEAPSATVAALRSRAQLGVGDFDEAAATLAAAANAPGDRERLLLARADLALARCRGEARVCESEDTLREDLALARDAWEIAPDAAETRVRYAEALLRNGRSTEAIPLLKRARAQVPASYTVLRELGLAYLNTEQWAQAVELLRLASGWAANNPPEQRRIGDLLALAQQRRRAAAPRIEDAMTDDAEPNPRSP
ncbi:MAG: tetratricopeptide repeat protein [Pseudomonadota bacterium]